jgi:histidinol-phosphate aminotransferase
MINWLSSKLDRISKLDSYLKPEKVEQSIKLDSNENFALDSQYIMKMASRAVAHTDLREYPLEQYEEFYSQLCSYTGMDARYLGVGNGSDQIIELLLSIFGKGHEATVFTPTFSYFINRCELHGIKLNKVPLNRDNGLPEVEFLNHAALSDIVYICSPNNPTGNQFPETQILKIIEQLKEKLVLIDEAYVEFGNYSLAKQIANYDNLIILRTLSKACGLAGARVGYLIANERFANAFRTSIQSPYPINSFSLAVATYALSDKAYLKQTVELVKRERERVSAALINLTGVTVFKSDANFVFLASEDNYGRILNTLKDDRVVVKAFGNVNGLRGCLRVTIGTSEMNDKFLKSIYKAVGCYN